MHTDLPLFNWQPPCKLIAFPLANRVGRIRHVASKLVDKTTDRHADYYRCQVNEGLVHHLQKLGLSRSSIDRELDRFWHEVDIEVSRQAYRGHRPGGAA
jgi:hypothetical protein